MDVVCQIHDAFLQEAEKSPILLNDLANMERYIAESYSGRSLIELLQNADDADANRFLIKRINDNVFAIANDGKEFDEDDLWALCRSGASSKKRKGNTIGYRGIGFKSIVNYASVVHLYSGSIQASFSRDETINLLPNAALVPLIRIPHTFLGYKYLNDINDLLQQGYKTIFIFETINSCLLEEISIFDPSCMLFLRNVQEILFETNSDRQVYVTKRKIMSEVCEQITYMGTTENNVWMVYYKDRKDDVRIAFKYDGKKLINATTQESVIHSFMPTNDRINIPLKINGDFSTDPSRTKVVMDDETEQALDLSVNLICLLIQKVFEKREDEYGLINILSQAKLDPLRGIKGNSLSDNIIERIIENAKNLMEEYSTAKQGIYLQPEGILDRDFEEICKAKYIFGIGNRLERDIPGIIAFSKLIGISMLPIDVTLSVMESQVLSKETRVEVFSEIIERARLGIDKDSLDLLNNANIITFDSGVKRITECDKDEMMEEGFEGAVLDKIGSFLNVEWFYKTIGIPYRQRQSQDKHILENIKGAIPKSVDEVTLVYDQIADTKEFIPKSLGSMSIVKKWRTVEENVVEILRGMENVANVIDVAARNVGYDIEVIMRDGTYQYYEVKSVDSMGMAFSMTNNEFSSAVQYKDKYYLAIVHQDNKHMEICFIRNPIDSLNMTKRVTRWEWYCSSYAGTMVEYKVDNM